MDLLHLLISATGNRKSSHGAFCGGKVLEQASTHICGGPWLEVLEVWEARDVIGDDGTKPTLVPRVPLTNIAKTKLLPTLGLRDLDLIELTKKVVAKLVCIMSNSKTRGMLTL